MRKKKKKENSTELQEAKVYNNRKKYDLKNPQNLIRFHSANKINKYNKGARKKKKEKKSKRIYRTSQIIRIISVFLKSLLSGILSLAWSHSPPHLPRMPSNTVLVSGPAVRAAQILIWSNSCVFLPPMSIAIRTSAFSFVGALNDLLYILCNTESAQLIVWI